MIAIVIACFVVVALRVRPVSCRDTLGSPRCEIDFQATNQGHYVSGERVSKGDSYQVTMDFMVNFGTRPIEGLRMSPVLSGDTRVDRLAVVVNHALYEAQRFPSPSTICANDRYEFPGYDEMSIRPPADVVILPQVGANLVAWFEIVSKSPVEFTGYDVEFKIGRKLFHYENRMQTVSLDVKGVRKLDHDGKPAKECGTGHF